jgi:hypothetical protein
MRVCRRAEWGSVVSESEVLVMFVRVDGEDFVRKMFRRAQNSIKFEGRERKSRYN